MLKLYHATPSVCSIKVRIGLAEIGLDYDEVELDLQAGEQHDPEYLKLNPAGVVPTLIDDRLVLVESSLILDYVDREHNGGRLMPKGRAAEATTRHWLLRCLGIHAAINTLSISTAMRDRVLASKTPEEITAALARMPDPVARDKRRDLFDKGLDSVHVDVAIATLEATFRDMTKALSPGPWICGQTFGLSDIALVSYIDRLQRLGFEGLWQDRHGGVSDWLTEMQSRRSYEVEVRDRIPAGQAAKMREAGARHWPDLMRRL